MEDQLLKELRRRQIASAADLQQALGISQPTLSRLIGKNTEQVATIGQARATRYALRRNLRGMGTEFPIFQVTESGHLAELGSLVCLEGGRWYVHDPIIGAERLFEGVPYFLSDSQPQGFMGRAFPKQHPELQLPERITDWSDDDVMVAIANSGKDTIGNLIVGDRSMRAYLTDLAQPVLAIKESECTSMYSRLAESALQGDPAGSSAGGEQPKFAATVTNGSVNRHVLVKFSPADDSLSSQRWRDLLIAEHLASISLSPIVTVAESRLIESNSRIFLEVTRFDRTGEHGRIGVVSLGALDDEHYGRRDNWLAAAERLERDRLVSVSNAESMRVMFSYGGLIANTDRHFGNISFVVGHARTLSLAPAYDQLPMLYAPSNGQIVDRQFTVELPQSNAFTAWKTALPFAEEFWQRVVEHSLISQTFKDIAKENLMQLNAQARSIAKTISATNNKIESSLKEAQNIGTVSGKEFTLAQPLKKYEGSVLGVFSHHAVQNLGRSIVIHENTALSRNVETGESLSVKYDEQGRGIVIPRLRDTQEHGR